MAALIVCGVIFVAGFVNGMLGFGSGMIGMMVLTFTHGIVHAASLINLISLLLTGMMAWLMRDRIDWRQVGLILPTGVVGVVIGVSLLASIDQDIMRRALGVVVVLFAAWNLTDSASILSNLSRRWGVAAGLASGTLQGAMNTGGPPLVAYLYTRPGPPAVAKASTQLIFLVFASFRVPAAAAHGMFTEAVMLDFAIAAPALLIGMHLGMRIGDALEPDRFRRLVWIAFGLMGLALALR